MKEIIIIGTMLLLSWQTAFSISMRVDECISFYDKHAIDFKSIADDYCCDVSQVASIALPEVYRYKEWQNHLEQTALRQFYISGGKEQADFSIGFFQMKPSFIEALECEVVNDEFLMDKYSFILPQGDLIEEEVRRFRLENLENINIQFEYLCVYFKIMEHKYQELFFTEKDKIKFIASAYNYGFLRGEQKIMNWMNVKAFPYGSKFNFEQDAFSDVSFHIYECLKKTNC